jgi:hypothetical protein
MEVGSSQLDFGQDAGALPEMQGHGKGPRAAGRKQTYVVCLDCGAEFDYDFRTMRLGKRSAAGVETRSSN